ncbi:MAG: hypothetical protein AB1733_08050 [Thermodesulfobacteriota bacterium]
MAKNSAWEPWILEKMAAGAVTFAWDDREVRTIPAPQGALAEMQKAWDWIAARMKELETERGKPRVVCFRLDTGEFRGLRFPDLNPGAL